MRQRIIGLATLCLLLIPSAYAQSVKIGFVNTDVIIANMPEYQQVYTTLQQEAEGDRTAYQALIQDYQEKLDRYQKQQALLSEERRQEREQELIQLQQDIQQAETTSQQKLARREQELLQPLFDRVGTAIEEIAKEKSIDLVLQFPSVLYANDQTVLNLTPDVATKLGLVVEGDEQAVNSN
ncbi:MAG: OmpH family outer membrane protein [Rhodothermales bacterium]